MQVSLLLKVGQRESAIESEQSRVGNEEQASERVTLTGVYTIAVVYCFHG